MERFHGRLVSKADRRFNHKKMASKMLMKKEEKVGHLNEPDVEVFVDEKVPPEDLEGVLLAVGVQLLPHALERRHHDLPGVGASVLDTDQNTFHFAMCPSWEFLVYFEPLQVS